MRRINSPRRGDLSSTIYTLSEIAEQMTAGPMRQAEFLAQAWRLGNEKARELGWSHDGTA
jgi:hypothetical protein